MTTETMDRVLPPGCMEVGGRTYMPDAKGNLVPRDLVAAQTQLEDETVRKIMSHARDLSSQIGRFRGHTMTDLGELDALIAQEYGLTKGGPKGNRTYQTFDGCQKIEVRVSDFIDFGPELQVSKALVDECLTEWAAESRPEIQAIVILFNHGPASITISGSTSDVEPAEMIGPSIPPGFALPVSFPLIELFPGIAGVNRLWAIAGVGGANVFVSHA